MNVYQDTPTLLRCITFGRLLTFSSLPPCLRRNVSPLCVAKPGAGGKGAPKPEAGGEAGTMD